MGTRLAVVVVKLAGAAGLVRGLVRALLWAAALRALASGVGVWAAGSLGTLTTFLIAVVAPAWLFVVFPTWITWRLPWRWRARQAKQIGCWLSPLVRARDLPGIRVFLDVAAGRPFPAPQEVPADTWTALAAALQAERQRDFARAERIVEALVHLPPGSRFPWLARLHGVEALVLAAVARQDWAAAQRYLVLGVGRLNRFLALLARAASGDPLIAPRALAVRWALAPGRRRSWPLVRARLRGPAAPAVVTPAPAALAAKAAEPEEARAGALDPRLGHLLLLSAAAEGRPLAMDDVFALAAAWDADLSGAALARAQARALELDVRDAAGAVRGLRDAVLEELVQLCTVAQGALPAPAPSDASLAAALATRARDRLFAMVSAALRPLDPETISTSPLAVWEDWLALRTLLERIEEQAGPVALTSLWHGGVRDTVWNATCALFNHHQERAAWVAHGMFSWVADRADCLGDLSTALLNRENARVAFRIAQ